MSYIIYAANQNRAADYKLDGVTTVYRGLKLKPEELAAMRVGTKTNLMGYTSTSKDKEKA